MSESKSIPLTRIIPSRWQPRNAVFDAEKLWGLASSIKENGLINAVVVFPVTLAEDDPEPWYELVAGERRTRASAGLAWGKLDVYITPKAAVEKLAREGLAALPDDVRRLLEEGGASIEATVEAAGDLERLHRVAVVENLERESLSVFEEAAALQALGEEYGWSQRELAKRVGKSQSFIAQRLALTGLSDEMKAAVNTRVLTPTHARAIASVPSELQPVVIEWAAGARGRDDTPATTRQVQNRARQLAAFVDSNRWLPNENHVYRPVERNRLAMMRWAVGNTDMSDRGEALLGLCNEGQYNNSNWLAKKPVALVQSDYGLGETLMALGYQNITGAWAAFAAQEGRMCATCQLNGVSLNETGDMTVHCPRWMGKKAGTCQGWIGLDSPTVIPLHFNLARWFREAGAEYEMEPFEHCDSIGDYLKGVALAVVRQREAEAASKEKKALKHIVAIQEYVDWQADHPGRLAHFQAHACAKCIHQLDTPAAPCRFALEPLTYHNGDARAPEFAVWVDLDGGMYPRCEMFTYREILVRRQPGMQFVDPQQATRWLKALTSRGTYPSRGLGGVLRWLNGEPKIDKLLTWIRRNWSGLGGDEVVATLLDIALAEARMIVSSRPPYKLLNAVTGEMESFAIVDWRLINGSVSYSPYGYPKDWPRPWEETSSDSAQQA